MNKYAHLAPPPPPIPTLASRHKNKMKYGHLEAARRHAQQMERREGTPFACYICPVCGWYHIGHAWGGKHHGNH